MEVLNQYTSTSTGWLPFLVSLDKRYDLHFRGSVAVDQRVALLCCVAFCNIGGGNYDKITRLRLWRFVSYALFFNTFPINMVLQYKKVGRWADYRYGELWYVFLSLGVEEPARVGRLRRDAAAELIRRLTIFKFIS